MNVPTMKRLALEGERLLRLRHGRPKRKAKPTVRLPSGAILLPVAGYFYRPEIVLEILLSLPEPGPRESSLLDAVTYCIGAETAPSATLCENSKSGFFDCLHIPVICID